MQTATSEVLIYIKVMTLFLFFAWIPGYALMRWVKIGFLGMRSAVIFLPFVFGIPLVSVIYLLLRMTHTDGFIVITPLLATASLLKFLRKGDFIAQIKSFFKFSAGNRKDFALFLIIFSFLLFFAISYGNRSYYDKSGGFVIGDAWYNDDIWSAVVTSELKHHVPPRLPVLSGFQLRYHYLGDLFTELLYRLSGSTMTTLEFNFKYEPPFFIFLLLGLLYVCLSYCFQNSITTFLAIALITVAPFQLSFFFKHHTTLGLLLFYGAQFFCLTAYFRNPHEKGFLIGAFFLMGMLPLYDATFGLISNGTIFCYSLIRSIQSKEYRPLIGASVSGLFLGGIVYMVALGWPGGHVGSLHFGEGPQMDIARERFKWITEGLKIVLNCMPGSQTPIGHLQTEIIKGSYHVICLILSFFIPPKDAPLSYHFLAIPLIYSVLRNPSKFERTWEIVLWITIACTLYSIILVYKRGPGVSVTLRGIQFANLILYPFTALAIQKLWFHRRILGKGLVALLFLIYVLPNYWRAEFYLKPNYYSYVDRETLEVFNFIKNKTPVSSTVLHPFQDNPIYKVGKGRRKPSWIFKGHYFFLSSLGERQAVFEGAATSTTYYMGGASYEEVVEREHQVNQFYKTLDSEWAKSFLKKYGVNYVWVPRDNPLSFNAATLLIPVFENTKHTLYQVK